MQVIETYWSKPVAVKLQNGLDHTFHSVEDALDFLENEWPIKHGSHRQRAAGLCKGALNRQVSPEAAREAFISACFEANMPPSFYAHHRFAAPQKAPLVSRFQ